MARLKQLWRGELPLDVAFWNWAIIGGLALNLVTTVLFFILLEDERPVAALLLGYGPSIPYNVVVAVAVVRAAERYTGPRHLATLARLVAVVGMLILSIT